MGKHKPIYDPSGTPSFSSSSHNLARNVLNTCSTVDCGDYVIVTNAKNVKVTGRKSEQLLFRKHSMFPGGLKETPYKAMMDKNPDEVRTFYLFHGFSSLITGFLTFTRPVPFASLLLPPLLSSSHTRTHAYIQIIRQAVSGMLPKNKLRERRLERLKIFPAHRMGILGGNIMRSWDDGTLLPDHNPSIPTTSETLKLLAENKKTSSWYRATSFLCLVIMFFNIYIFSLCSSGIRNARLNLTWHTTQKQITQQHHHRMWYVIGTRIRTETCKKTRACVLFWFLLSSISRSVSHKTGEWPWQPSSDFCCADACVCMSKNNWTSTTC